jgi:hypothetical protein
LQDFHSAATNLPEARNIDSDPCISANPALDAAFANLARRTAQNPVILLWTACIRLKNQYLQIHISH